MGAPGLDFETWEIVHSKYEIMRPETWGITTLVSL
jgi:hypothetical protein